jgi:hypothetical protein
LREALLAFEKVSGAHTGENLGQILFDILSHYGIGHKIFCCTTDSASNNKTMLESLGVLLHTYNEVSWDEATYHIACINHVLNLSVQDFMKTLKATRLAAADIAEFEAINIDEDNEDEDEEEPIVDEIVFVITDETSETTIIDLLFKLKTLAKVPISLSLSSHVTWNCAFLWTIVWISRYTPK